MSELLKKTALTAAAIIGALATAVAALSGLGAFLSGGSRAAFDDPTIIWFAPLFLTPVALVGAVLVLVASLVSRCRRALAGWSAAVMLMLLAITAAVFTLSGLSSGEIELSGTLWGTVAVAMSLLYAASVLVVSGVGVSVAKVIIKKAPAA